MMLDFLKGWEKMKTIYKDEENNRWEIVKKRKGLKRISVLQCIDFPAEQPIQNIKNMLIVIKEI